MSNVSARCSSVMTSPIGPSATTSPPRRSRAWREAGRDLLHVVRDQHRRRRGRVHRQGRQGRDEVLAAAEVEPGGGLVEQQQLGVGHQRPRDLHPLALAFAEGAEGAVEQVVGADLPEQLAGAVVVEVVVRLAPAPDHAVRRGHDDVADQLVSRDALRQSGTGEPDPGPQLEDVDGAEDLVEDAGDAVRRGGSGRPRPGAAWSCRRRWARAPPIARPRRPATRSGRATSPGPVGRSRRRTRSPRPCGNPSEAGRSRGRVG